ncbi:MAG: NAD(P)H-dependent oxidoreductase [Pseudomonadota bacterium]
MRVLTVLDHPDPGSLSAAAAARFGAGAQAAGHEVELADLHAERFDPRWSPTDVARQAGGPTPPDLLREQARIDRADAVCLVFPLYWWGMPAMTKGWIDRVWSFGWAYDQLDDPEKSLQRPRTLVLLVLAGARSDEMEQEGFNAALETAWLKGTFGYFGFTRRTMEVLNGTEGSEARRKALLERAREAGRTLAPPPEPG